MIALALLDNGLFGGLRKELRIDDEGILEHVNKDWRVPGRITSVQDLDAWHRGGGETYIAHSVLSSLDAEIKVIGKAFVAWGRPPESQRIAWEARRVSFQKAGVRVPHLFSSERALSIEEFVPHAVDRNDLSHGQAFDLGQTVKAMLGLGLRPLSIWSDVRSTGDDIVYIDFGSDIIADGDPSWATVVEASVPVDRRDDFRLGLLGRSVVH